MDKRFSFTFTLVPRTRPIGCLESWVAYLARCARQRRCREVPTIAVGDRHSLCVDVAGRLLACGTDVAVGHGCEGRSGTDPNCPRYLVYPDATPVAFMAGVRVRSVAAVCDHSLALGWDGRVYSWGWNCCRQLGRGHTDAGLKPALVERATGVRGITTSRARSLAVTQSGAVLNWGRAFLAEAGDEDTDDLEEDDLVDKPHALRPVVVKDLKQCACATCTQGWVLSLP
jgi:alpha-tubulin suppressor-like RCC1 family protein